jgi:hypothetical protein
MRGHYLRILQCAAGLGPAARELIPATRQP